MKKCCKCGKPVETGYIICSQCNDSKGITLDYYIDQLAELITTEYLGMCSLCIYHGCGQQSGLVCRKGVSAYLTGLITKFEQEKKITYVWEVRKLNDANQDYVVTRFESSTSSIEAWNEARDYIAAVSLHDTDWYYYLKGYKAGDEK